MNVAVAPSAHSLGASFRAGEPLGIGRAQTRNRVFLAPLSGITDVPFRRLARRFGAGLVFSEMVASGELIRGRTASLLRAMRDGDGMHAVQLAGRELRWMAEAASILASEGVELIDINMGCPAKKVVGGGRCGAALMREPELVEQIIAATIDGAGGVPVSVKMRLGWDDASRNAATLAQNAASLGAAMVTIHGRTRAQFYEGNADWQAIGAIRDSVRVPLVANGDLRSRDEVGAMVAASRADAVMIGRACQGRPWLPGFIAGAVSEAELASMSYTDLVCEHYEMMLTHYGREAGLRQARKHLGWYLEPFEADGFYRDLRIRVLASTSPDDVLRMISGALSSFTLADAEASKNSRPLAA